MKSSRTFALSLSIIAGTCAIGCGGSDRAMELRAKARSAHDANTRADPGETPSRAELPPNDEPPRPPVGAVEAPPAEALPPYEDWEHPRARSGDGGTIQPLKTVSGGFAVGGEPVMLAPAFAKQYGLGRSAGGVDLALHLDFFDIITTEVSGGAILPQDRDAFSVPVVEKDGTVAQGHSTARMGIISLAGGFRTPVLLLATSADRQTWFGSWLSLRGGVSWTAGSRNIDHTGGQDISCSDCPGDRFKAQAGGFIEPGLPFIVKVSPHTAIAFSGGFRGYLSGSLSYEVPLRLDIWWL